MSFLYETLLWADTGRGSRTEAEKGRPTSYFYYKFNSTDRNTKNLCLRVSDHSQLTALKTNFQFGNHRPNTLSLVWGQTFKHKNQKRVCHRWSVAISRGLGAGLQGGPAVRPNHSWASSWCWRGQKPLGQNLVQLGCQAQCRQGLAPVGMEAQAGREVQSSRGSTGIKAWGSAGHREQAGDAIWVRSGAVSSAPWDSYLFNKHLLNVYCVSGRAQGYVGTVLT